MRFEIELFHICICQVLCDRVALQLSCGLEFLHPRKQFLRSEDPADPCARNEDLGECSHVYNAVAVVEREQRRQLFSGITEFAVRVVLEDQQVRISNCLKQLLAAGKAHAFACRILERRDSVEAFCIRVFLHLRFQVLDADSFIIHLKADELREVLLESIQSAHVCRCLNEYYIALFDNSLAEEVHSLLRAAGEKDLVQVFLYAVQVLRTCKDLLTERSISFCRAVLKSLRAFFDEYPRRYLHEFLFREELRCRQSGSKADHFGFVEQAEQYIQR